MQENKLIGYLVGGGLKENFRVRLTISPQEIQEGAFVVIQSGSWNYYGIVTDIQLGSTDPRFADEQTEVRFPASIAKALHGQTLYANLEVLPNLMLEIGPELGTPEYNQWQGQIDAGLKDKPHVLPVKNIPPHHAPVYLAGEGDIDEIFGKPDDKRNFVIGYTREQKHAVRIDLEKFVKRSSGIFGATGTGKSFLTRIILAGLIQYDESSLLIFDMHNEYGLNSRDTDNGKTVVGLKSKFSSRVRVVGLGKGTIINEQNPDFHLEVAMEDIQPSDIEMLWQQLNLTETAPTVLSGLVKEFGRKKWLSEFLALESGKTLEDEKGKRFPSPDSVEGLALRINVHPEAAKALHSRLSNQLAERPYIMEKPAADTIGEIIKSLENGQHIVLSFGKYDRDLDYLLISNLLTRKIRERWEKKTDQFRSGSGEEPRPLVIVVEEAHKLLNREMASQTTFATIARELRKYYVTLLVIDQRPSQIYDEVMSQLGTRISGWLGDDDDIHAVLSGLSGREALRGMLARLQPKEEVLLLGWGVPMPLPVKSRRYDDDFWKELLGASGKRSEKQNLKELGF
jgi:DNA helicase HerA-like ATPase